jgi:hypothetical protein
MGRNPKPKKLTAAQERQLEQVEIILARVEILTAGVGAIFSRDDYNTLPAGAELAAAQDVISEAARLRREAFDRRAKIDPELRRARRRSRR